MTLRRFGFDLLLMGADLVKSLCRVAIPTEHLKDRRESFPLDVPQVAAVCAGKSRSFPAMFCPIVVDVIDRQELIRRFTAAGTHAAVCIKNFLSNATTVILVVLAHVRELASPFLVFAVLCAAFGAELATMHRVCFAAVCTGAVNSSLLVILLPTLTRSSIGLGDAVVATVAIMAVAWLAAHAAQSVSNPLVILCAPPLFLLIRPWRSATPGHLQLLNMPPEYYIRSAQIYNWRAEGVAS